MVDNGATVQETIDIVKHERIASRSDRFPNLSWRGSVVAAVDDKLKSDRCLEVPMPLEKSGC